jgi:hypothetical protein
MRPAGKIALIVDEMGFLAELYSIMDWAFVGGGFGASIHSTIEPAIYGLPIFGGPRGEKKFDEIGLLKKQNQLHLYGSEPEGRGTLRSSDDFSRWLSGALPFDQTFIQSHRSEWRVANERHRGASERIWFRLVSILKGVSVT